MANWFRSTAARARFLGIGACSLAAMTALAAAQTPIPMAPWFDTSGFYFKPGVGMDEAADDLNVCWLEAARLKKTRNTYSGVAVATAFNANGTYNPGVSLAAGGIATVFLAIQDARYNGSIELTEYRTCAQALGYRHARLDVTRRNQFDTTPDRGFAALVSAATPSEGRLDQSVPDGNYYAAIYAPKPFQNGSPREAKAAETVSPAAVVPPIPNAAMQPEPAPPTPALLAETAPDSGEKPAVAENAPVAAAPAPSVAPAPEPQIAAPGPATPVTINRVAPGSIAAPGAGQAIVVVSARSESPFSGQVMRADFWFRQVPDSGEFLALGKPEYSQFQVETFHNEARKRDPSMAGDAKNPRYSTYVVPIGRYALHSLGPVGACLGTLTFDIREGEVLYLGDLVLHTPGMPFGSMLNPIANANTALDNKMKSDLRMAIGEDLDAARAALQADDGAKAKLARASYANGYRIPCAGAYNGRVEHPEWSAFDPAQMRRFHRTMVEIATRK